MTADQAITQAAEYARVARQNGNEAAEAYWTERAVRLSDEAEAARHRLELADTMALTSRNRHG